MSTSMSTLQQDFDLSLRRYFADLLHEMITQQPATMRDAERCDLRVRTMMQHNRLHKMILAGAFDGCACPISGHEPIDEFCVQFDEALGAYCLLAGFYGWPAPPEDGSDALPITEGNAGPQTPMADSEGGDHD